MTTAALSPDKANYRSEPLAPRSDFPLLAGSPNIHYLDSAATSQKPAIVLDTLRGFYESLNANPHRGAYALSAAATDAYHSARIKVAHFLGASDSDCLVFTRGTTESINLIATAWGTRNVHQGDEIVITALEHHANFVTWQQLARATGATLRIAEITERQEIDLDSLRSLLSARTKVVAITHVSNAVGSITPLSDAVRIVRENTNALIVVDGAQGAPHLPVHFDSADIDFYVFSGHKMLGPMGVGGVIGRRAIWESTPPYQYGGDMIEWVNDFDSSWNVLPHKFEAGTPNAANAVALAAATEYLGKLDMQLVREHEVSLLTIAEQQLREISGIRIYGPPVERRSGVLSFSLDDVHPHDIATVLDQHNVCIRAGHHCAQPLMRRLGVSATARASFYVYNELTDVSALCESLKEAQRLLGSE